MNRNHILQFTAGIVTALIVLLVSVSLLWQQSILSEAIIWQLILITLLYIVISDTDNNKSFKHRRIAFAAMLPLIFLLSWRVPIDVFFIYSIIWIACSPTYIPVSFQDVGFQLEVKTF